jgi:hypothetical protein
MNIEHRDYLGKALNEVGLVGHGVEVGTYRGEFATCILRNWKGKTLTCVDPWGDNFPPEWEHHAGMEVNYDICLALAMRDHRARMMRMESRMAVQCFDDNSLDFVYIDGDHSYEAVALDITCWYCKVKRGGILCGHDYVEKHGPVPIGVIRAVNEYATAMRHQIHTTSESVPSWWIQL